MNIKVGQGIDVHAFCENRPLILGGVEIPYNYGLAGHSDADVLIHAVCDALLGAAHLRDIGYHFPDTDEQYAGIDSRILLKRVVGMLSDKGWRPGNVDVTLCAERPKLQAYIPQMQETLAGLLNCDSENVSIKATTTEKLGFVGRREGIAAFAVVLIEKI